MAIKSNEFKTLVHKQWAKVSKSVYDFNVPINLTLRPTLHSRHVLKTNFTTGLQCFNEN